MPALKDNPVLDLQGGKTARFNPEEDIVWQGWLMDNGALPHPNTIRFRLWQAERLIVEETTMSVGGGFVETVDPLTGQGEFPVGILR